MAETAKHMISLEWKDFNVGLSAVHAWLKENVGEAYSGIQAHERLEVWFKEEPKKDEIELIKLYWEEIKEDGPEAINYKSQAELNHEIESTKQSAMEKLTKLGLSLEEIAALIK